MDTRKRKRLLKPSLSLTKSLLLYFSFFLFILFLSHHFRFGSGSFRPARIIPNLSVFSSSVSNSIQDFTTHGHHRSIRTRNHGLPLELSIENRVLFSDHVLVILSANEKYPRSSRVFLGDRIRIDCVYQDFAHPMLSVDKYDDFRWIIRCPLPPANYSAAVGLKFRRKTKDVVVKRAENQTVIHSWDMVVYEAVLDGEETIAVFVKGLNLRSDRESDPSRFSCHIEDFGVTTAAITAAQEVIRCPLPRALLENPRIIDEGVGNGITIEMTSHEHRRSHRRGTLHQLVPSIAKLYYQNDNNKGIISRKFELCACTMVWNQAAFIREWITYHAWLGVQRWFVYDNNSDDGLKKVINELDSENYNVSRHVWPWVKSQEAGFSHCVLRAREHCNWVAFFDVDEFYYFPSPKGHHDSSLGYLGPDSLRAIVNNVSSSSPSVGEIRTDCHSFGPSGLRKNPAQGLTVGYTCRLQSPERHKSIINPNAVDETLLNQVHHFRLKKDFNSLNLPQSIAVINHYKYQVWDVFKSKFYRRVSTYVADWQENHNEGSRDRAPGLGTEAIEPPNWHLRFCEVWDTGLRDFVMVNLADPITGLLPWEKFVQ